MYLSFDGANIAVYPFSQSIPVLVSLNFEDRPNMSLNYLWTLCTDYSSSYLTLKKLISQNVGLLFLVSPFIAITHN